jgi:hypothetical protein
VCLAEIQLISVISGSCRKKREAYEWLDVENERGGGDECCF